jgi:hypothetical protein
MMRISRALAALAALVLVSTLAHAQVAITGAGPSSLQKCGIPEAVIGTNLIQTPDDFDGEGWSIASGTDYTTTSVVVAQNQGTAPDGTNSLNAITDNSFNGSHVAWQSGLNPSAPGVYTFSVYLKQGTLRYAQLVISDANTDTYGVVFDLQAGAVGVVKTLGTPTQTTSKITPVGGGLYLASVALFFAHPGNNLYGALVLSNTATPSTYDQNGYASYVGTGQDIFAWNASLTTPLSVGNVCVAAATPWVTAGYNLNTFHASSFSAANVDTQLTRNPGFQFYLTGSFGYDDTPAANLTFNSDGSLTMSGTGCPSTGCPIYSVAAKGTPASAWRGTAFGGGAYFEAVLSFNPADTNHDGGANGWPAWWADPVEHAAESSINSDNWQGLTTGYVHYTETDFAEYNVWTSGNRLFQYRGTVIDWSGVWDGSEYPFQFQNNDNNLITLPIGTDFTQKHAYGFLWVPATSSTSGYFQWYFDRVPVSARVTYGQYNCTAAPSPPAASNSPWLYGVLDCQHPELILNPPQSTGTLTIYSVDVWQASSAGNIVQ